MTPTFNDKLIAYLVLLSGLAISGVAEYYSIMGLISIYPAAFWPIVIMGVVLGLGKVTGTVWLKQNWDYAPWFLKTYILPAIIILMLITSLGVFGYLSKAHSDQSLVSGDVQAKIAVYDEKIKTSKDNIDANRKALKQMDEAVDQVMGRSQDEKGADKAVAIRRGQQKERTRLQAEITAEQKTISQLSEERAPIAAEVRKVEAEVGPIKYIAHLLYGENPDANILEKAVIWVTVLIVIVLDPLAVVLLLASQFSFQRFREQEDEQAVRDWFDQGRERARQLDEEVAAFVTDDEIAEGDSPQEPDIVSTSTVTTSTVSYQIVDEFHEPDYITPPPTDEVTTWNKMIAEAEKAVEAEKVVDEVIVTQVPEGTMVSDKGGTIVIPADAKRPKSVVPIGNGDYVMVDGQVYHHKAYDNASQTSHDIVDKHNATEYVQNEEQQEENTLWKDISVVTETQYLETARKHQVEVFAEQVVAGVLALDNINSDIKEEVVAQIEKMKAGELDKREEIINSLVRQVRSEMLKLDQIPPDLIDAVKERI